jgi:hypothetical protein
MAIGIEINKVDDGGYSPLAYTVMNNHLSSFKLLVQYGASMKWEGRISETKNCTLLHIAAYYGRFQFIPILLNHGISATAIDEKKQTPLLLLTKFIATKYQDTLKNSTDTDELYKTSITALAYLLSYSHEQNMKPENDHMIIFYKALTSFRKNIAILYTLHTSGALRLPGVNLPKDIIQNIAVQLNEDVPSDAYKYCYRDILMELLTKRLLHQFITLGMQSVYNEFQLVMQNSMNPLNAIKKKFSELIPLQEEKKQLPSSYSPRTLLSGAISLTAVTFAQKQMRENPTKAFFKNDKYNERRLAIKEWKKKVENKEDEGLSQAIIQACKEMGIHEIDNHILEVKMERGRGSKLDAERGPILEAD